MNDQVLAKIDKARVYLMEAKTASQVQQVMALADAARIYGKQVGASTEAINYASEIRVRAERKLGEILIERGEYWVRLTFDAAFYCVSWPRMRALGYPIDIYPDQDADDLFGMCDALKGGIYVKR